MSDAALTLPSLGEVLRSHGIEPHKSLGQNFLLDPRLTSRIALATGPLEGINVVEIGPGPGGLTRAILAAGAARVVAIERDSRCLPALEELAKAYPGRLDIIAADAMAIDPVELVPSPRRLIANLPYNIGTPLLIQWLRRVAEWDALGLMFQKEVAQRITAKIGDKNYGRLAILSQWLTQPAIAFDVPPGAFIPPPKVTSSVVRLKPRAEPLAPCNFKDLEKITAAAFGQRRKMLRSSLKSLDLSQPTDLFCEEAGVKPTARAEELPVEAFCALARLLERDASR